MNNTHKALEKFFNKISKVKINSLIPNLIKKIDVYEFHDDEWSSYSRFPAYDIKINITDEEISNKILSNINYLLMNHSSHILLNEKFVLRIFYLFDGLSIDTFEWWSNGDKQSESESLENIKKLL